MNAHVAPCPGKICPQKLRSRKLNKKKVKTNAEELIDESIADDCLAINAVVTSKKRRWVDDISDLSVPNQQPTLEAFSEETSTHPGIKRSRSLISNEANCDIIVAQMIMVSTCRLILVKNPFSSRQ